LSFASPIAAALIPTVLVLNAVLVVTKVTRTIDVDLWNYWHFIYTGAVIHAATHSIGLGIAGACVTAFRRLPSSPTGRRRRSSTTSACPASRCRTPRR